MKIPGAEREGARPEKEKENPAARNKASLKMHGLPANTEGQVRMRWGGWGTEGTGKQGCTGLPGHLF